MARRTRSYRAGKDPLGVFINNSIASSQKRARAEQKASAAASNRASREAQRERARNSRDAERAQARNSRAQERAAVRAEKESERNRKLQDKENSKVEKIYVRLESDIVKMGLYPGRTFITTTSREAVRLSVSAAQTKSYFVKDNVEEIAKTCAAEFLGDQGITSSYKQFNQFNELLNIVTELRPQQDAPNVEQYSKLKQDLEEEMQAYLAKVKRQEDREALISDLTKSMKMFKDELEEFAEIIEVNDWSRKESTNSDEYRGRTKNKKKYVAQIRSQITPIKLTKKG